MKAKVPPSKGSRCTLCSLSTHNLIKGTSTFVSWQVHSVYFNLAQRQQLKPHPHTYFFIFNILSTFFLIKRAALMMDHICISSQSVPLAFFPQPSVGSWHMGNSAWQDIWSMPTTREVVHTGLITFTILCLSPLMFFFLHWLNVLSWNLTMDR